MACAMDASAKAQAKIAAPSSDPAVTLPLLHLAARDLPQALSSSEKLTSTQGKFLHLYCRYMEGEQQRNTSVSIEEMIAGKSDQGNPHLLSIRRDLETLHQSDRDGFTLFLYGAVLAQLQQKEKAIEALIESVRLLPGNYAAWQELVSLYRPKQNTVLQLPVHWATSLFEALLFLEMRDGERALAPLAELRKLFPGSAFLISNHALAYYMSVRHSSLTHRYAIPWFFSCAISYSFRWATIR
jgi:anaphase-promoting complex subunit 8